MHRRHQRDRWVGGRERPQQFADRTRGLGDTAPKATHRFGDGNVEEAGVRESLENQTMRMAKTAAELLLRLLGANSPKLRTEWQYRSGMCCDHRSTKSSREQVTSRRRFCFLSFAQKVTLVSVILVMRF